MNFKHRSSSRFFRALAGSVGFLLLLFSTATTISYSAQIPTRPEKIIDDETVYAILDSSGNWKKTIVIDWLRIKGKGKVIVEDKYDGFRVENLKGSEKPYIRKNLISWVLTVNQERDFYYRIDTRKKPPLSVEVTYYLNGKHTTPKKLAGKSGHLKIVIKVKNKLKKEAIVSYKDANGKLIKKKEEIYIPLLTTVNLSFQSSRFDNIKTECGLLNVSGEKTSIMWMIFPQGEEKVVVEMDGKDIELDPIMISAFPQLPESQEIEMEDQFEQLKEGLEGLSLLTGAQSQLLGYLEQGINPDKFSQLSAVNSQFESFKDGTSSLYSGVKGIEQLLNGQLAVLDGIIQGIDSNQFESLSQLNEGLDQVSTGLKSIKAGVDGISQGLAALIENHKQLTQLANERASYYSSDTTLSTLAVGLSEETADLSQLKANLDTISSSLGSTISSLDLIAKQAQALGQIPSAFDSIRQSLITVRDGGNIGDRYLPGLKSTSQSLGKIAGALGQSSAAIGKVSSDLSNLSELPGMLLRLKEMIITVTKGGIVENRYLPGMNESKRALNEMAAGVGEGLEEMRFGSSLKEVLQKEAESYDTFIGKPKNATGRVRFIYKVEGIEKK